MIKYVATVKIEGFELSRTIKVIQDLLHDR